MKQKWLVSFSINFFSAGGAGGHATTLVSHGQLCRASACSCYMHAVYRPSRCGGTVTVATLLVALV